MIAFFLLEKNEKNVIKLWKHRHARRARVIFCDLKHPGGSSTLLAVETHRTITRGNRVRSARGAGKHQKIQHSNRVSRFFSQNISRINFSAKPLRLHTNLYKFKPSSRCNTTPPYAARRESRFAWSNCRFSHDVTKFQTSVLLILLRFYFYDV